MADLSLASTLLTLFAPYEVAQSIEGDLLEESRARGRLWFWTQVARTTGALWWKGLAVAPLARAGWTLACCLAWASLAYLAETDDSPGLFVLGTLLVGFVGVRTVPAHGIHAAFALAILAGPLALLGSGLFGSPVVGSADRVLCFASGLPLLLGAVLARRRAVRKAVRA